MKYSTLTSLLLFASSFIFAQQNGAHLFFPEFIAHSSLPIFKYGEELPGASWNDPSVLKVDGNYIMYASAGHGILGDSTIKIYRLTSTDGYDWTLSPSTPVLEPLEGSYYSGGTETPNVIFYKGAYHMYTTVYPGGFGEAENFAIAHATSPDGISWTMDPAAILESDGSATWNGTIVAEPGVEIINDSLYLFYTGAGFDGVEVIQSIGLLKSVDGATFSASQRVVDIPRDLYPKTDNWYGLSTPSATLVEDTLYLFTDIAQEINGDWTQVALHQFKSGGDFTEWFYDLKSIHHKDDFSWTDGNHLSEIRSIDGLYENGELRIWYAGNHIGDIVGTDTTFNAEIINGEIHILPDYWGIGTSEADMSIVTSVHGLEKTQNAFVQNNTLYLPNQDSWKISIINTQGQTLIETKSSENLKLPTNLPELYLIRLENDNTIQTIRALNSLD